MHHKRSLLLPIISCFFLLTNLTVNAQGQFRSGFIVTHDQDTLYGKKEDRPGKDNYERCLFIKDEELIKYKPADIAAYGYKYGELYSSSVIEGAFVEVVVSGKLSLYKHAGDLYVQKVGDKPRKIERLESEFTRIVKRSDMKWQVILSTLTADCPKELDQDFGIGEKNLTDFVVSYNECMGEESFVPKAIPAPVYGNGYLVTLANDTLYKQIDRGAHSMVYDVCRVQKGDRDISYTPDQILGYGFADAYFSSQLVGGTFTRKLLDGTIGLYQGKDCFYVQKDDGPLMQLREEDGQTGTSSVLNKWQTTLKSMTAECRSLSDPKFPLSKDRLVTYINEYHACPESDISEVDYADFVAAGVVKFGTVSLDEMKMTTYAGDSLAEAVVLFDKGKYVANTNRFERHRRIKVLKSGGTSYGNITLNVPGKSFIKGYVYNLSNGELVKDKLANESIMVEEEFEGRFVHKIFFPNVKVGSVIDLEYYHYGIPYQWNFQSLIPTVYSEVEMERTSRLEYSIEQRGFFPVKQLGERYWVAENVTAFKMEPNLNHFSNYLTKFEFRIQISWKRVGRILLSNERFGSIITGSNYLLKKAQEINSSILSDREKIFAAYEYIREEIKWNGRQSILASEDTKKNFQVEHSGNATEINLLLLSLLKKMGVQAYPVILSTKKQGVSLPFDPDIYALNYAIVLIMVDGQEILTDASMEGYIPGIIPEKCLNGHGWVITDAVNGRLVDLHARKYSGRRQFIQIKLDLDGNHTAQVSQAYSNYEYLDWDRKQKAAESPENFVRMLEEDAKEELNQNVIIDEYNVQRNEPVKLSGAEKFTIDLEGYLEDLGGEYLIDPYLLSPFKTNPLQSPDRRYPLDLLYIRRNSTSISIELPDGYHAQALPQPISAKLPDGSASFVFQAVQSGNVVQIQVQTLMDKPVYSEIQYQELRQLYSLMIKVLNEPIQIVKKV